MLFNSFVFLSFFLPFVLIFNSFLKTKSSNYFLLLSSLFFYYWGEPQLIILLVLSIFWNYVIGVVLQTRKKSVIILWLGIIGNILVLTYFKYLGLIVDLFDLQACFSQKSEVILPIGVSFFTFQGISYIIDIYRDEAKAQYDIVKLSLYISFFPQLVAGPIVKYKDISAFFDNREITLEGMTEGSYQLIRGLFKKILLANNFAVFSDCVFNGEYDNLQTSVAWLGVLAYSLQIYFDFSGYSDIAIGIARMMGFRLAENFHYPYISTSFKEFWKRWHISLSTWFKEYVYFSLGGNRVSQLMVYFNLFIVFFATGLWHGANLTFIAWGLLHGVFIISEKLAVKSFALPKALKAIIVVFFVSCLWVLFRVDSFVEAKQFYSSLFIYNDQGKSEALMYLNGFIITLMGIGVVIALPVREKVELFLSKIGHVDLMKSLGYIVLLLLCLVELYGTTYKSFIYFKF